MKYIVENWFVIVGLIAVCAAGGYAVYVFVKMPSDKQLNKVREWLLYAVTKAEIYAVKVIEEELNRKGIAPNSIERKIIITRTADVLAAHKEEVRDMYKKSGLLLQDWIIKMSGIKDLIAFKKMKQLGFTGDVMQDMKKMEEAR